MAGVPFDILERLATSGTTSAARELLQRIAEREVRKHETEKSFKSREHLLSEDAFRALRSAIRQGREPADVSGRQPSIFTNYADAAAKVTLAESNLIFALEAELLEARVALRASARKILPSYSCNVWRQRTIL